MATERLIEATERGEPMKRNCQSGGTTDIKCSKMGARIALGRFSMRRATLEALYGLMRGLSGYSNVMRGIYMETLELETRYGSDGRKRLEYS